MTLPNRIPDPQPAGRTLLDVRNLKKYFPIKGGLLSRTVGHVKAVDDISFDIKAGEVVGLVGESGSGKTTTGRTILRLTEPTEGQILFDGVDIAKLPKEEMRHYRKDMQIVFQDPYASLNPRLTVEETLMQAFRIHGLWRGSDRQERIADLLAAVGLSRHHMTRYPHEFSGGQRQRIGIA
ncbi:MAG: ATP-binding cassette domain-containing protein, partial [Microvirga sp.]